MIALIIMFDWLPNLKFFLDVATITRPALITMFGNWLVAKKNYNAGATLSSVHFISLLDWLPKKTALSTSKACQALKRGAPDSYFSAAYIFL